MQFFCKMSTNVQPIYFRRHNMRSKFKSIVSLVLMVVMLCSLSVPAMAADQHSYSVQNTIATFDNEVEPLAITPVAEFHYTGRLAEGKVLGSVEVNQNCKTLAWTVGRTESDGNVRFTLTNKTTGETRNITTTANNTLESFTYVSTLHSGTWKIKVAWKTNNWLYDLDLYFYKN